MSLATKYRPTEFDDVVEQNIAVLILQKQLEKKCFKNAYGFFGASGCGKTTLARIFANKINNGLGNPIEVDAASNNSVEAVRALVDAAKQRSLDSEYKVIIIDECHALGNGSDGSSNKAWQAFLKGLEEAPKYTIFIFCSTAPEKIPQTVLNRLQRFNFAPISTQGIKERLQYICKCEGFTNYEDSCDFISKVANNSMRDAITKLEQVTDLNKNMLLDRTKQVLGGIGYENLFRLTWALQNKNEVDIFNIIDSLEQSGQDLKYFIDFYLTFILDLVRYSLFNNINITSIPNYLATTENPVVQETTNSVDKIKRLNLLISQLLKIKISIKNDINYKSTILALLLEFVRGE